LRKINEWVGGVQVRPLGVFSNALQEISSFLMMRDSFPGPVTREWFFPAIN
jgi:hypothetical protein